MIVCFYVIQNACVGFLKSFWRPCSGVWCSAWKLLEAPWRSPEELEELLAASVLMTTQRDFRASQNKGRSTVTQGCKFDWDPLGRWALARNNRLDELNTFIGSQHFSRGFSCPRVLRTVMKSVSA